MGWLAGLKKNKNTRRGAGHSTSLDAMIQAYRGHDESARLSRESRDRILREALRGGAANEALPSLFTPARRIMVAGALPIALAAVLILGLEADLRSPLPVLDEAPTVAVAKRGDRVFFQIRNGSPQHVVYRSTEPDRFESTGGVRVADGTFEDGLQDQADLVFYRID